MGLKQYWCIIRRRLWIVITLPLVVLVGSVLLRSAPSPLYQATIRFTIGVEPMVGKENISYDPAYYAYLTSEYIADDFSEVVKSQAFADDVSRRLDEEGILVPAGAIQGSTVAEKQHRILTLNIAWGDAEQLARIAWAAVAVLREENAKYFEQLGAVGATVHVIDPPVVVPVGPSLRQRLDIPIRLLLAFVSSVALAFLVDYLDDSIREASELEALGIPVLGEIPGSASWRWPPWRRPKVP
ncbi:MAG: YveK family protein [Anaerolineae bacterium]